MTNELCSSRVTPSKHGTCKRASGSEGVRRLHAAAAGDQVGAQRRKVDNPVRLRKIVMRSYTSRM